MFDVFSLIKMYCLIWTTTMKPKGCETFRVHYEFEYSNDLGPKMMVWENLENDSTSFQYKQQKEMSRDMTKPTKWVCAQRRLRPAWASAQSDQSLRCPHEETLGPSLPIERTAKTLIRLGGCPGWSESSQGAHASLLVLSRCGSNELFYNTEHSY